MDTKLAERLVEFRKKMAESVQSNADKLAEIGLTKYLENKIT
jgi:hypothetical protein